MSFRRKAPVLQLCGARRYSTTSPAPPPTLAKWMEDMSNLPATFETDYIDHHRARQLASTLPTRSPKNALGLGQQLKDGLELPRGWSLIYFQPDCDMDALGLDGSWTTYNAPEPYTRRMWASGSFHFPPSSSPLAPGSATLCSTPRIGQRIRQTTRVSKVDFKKGMVFIEVEKRWFADMDEAEEPESKLMDDTKVEDIDGSGREREIERQGPDSTSVLSETRCHVFRREVAATSNATLSPPTSAKKIFAPPNSPSTSFTYTPTAPLLFRFSSLTFNAHRIHYDRDWAVNVEGQRGVVVHGPLTSLMLLELVESAVGRFNEDERQGQAAAGRDGERWETESFSYKATAPMIVDEEITMGVKWDGPADQGRRSCTAWATQNGVLGMSATAVARAIRCRAIGARTSGR